METKFFYQRMKIDVDTGCWNWALSRNKKGYGKFGSKGKMFRAHRASYEHFVGPIPDGLEIDHLCFNTSCINPKHLEPVTPEENRNRYYDKRQREADSYYPTLS